MKKILLISSCLFMLGCTSSGLDRAGESINELDTGTGTKDEDKTKISILALYSDTMKAMYKEDTEARIDHLIYIANKVNDNSRVDLRYEILDYEEYKTDDSLTMEEKLDSAILSIEIDNLRKDKKADIVTLFEPIKESSNLCGLGVINIELIEEISYSFSAVNCSDTVLAHELGHNLGLAHSHNQKDIGKYEYSYGYGIKDSFITIMSYEEVFNTENNKLLFSNPDIICEGEPCGIEEGYENAANAYKSVMQTKEIISKFN